MTTDLRYNIIKSSIEDRTHFATTYFRYLKQEQISPAFYMNEKFPVKFFSHVRIFGSEITSQLEHIVTPFFFGAEFFLVFAILFLLFIFVIVKDSKVFNNPNILEFSIKNALFSLFFVFFYYFNFIYSYISYFKLRLFRTYLFSDRFLFFQDSFTSFIKLISLICAISCLFMALRYFKKERIENYEFSILFLLSILGLFLIISATDFLSFYLAIELQSLSFYILASLKKNSNFSTEAGLKYFVLGAISSGFLLFGFSLLFGFTGFTNFADFNQFCRMTSAGIYDMEFVFAHYFFLKTTHFPAFGSFFEGVFELIRHYFLQNLLFFGLILVSSGIFFKLGIFPFHIWIPDVYEGVPTVITAIFALVPKLGILCFLLRFILHFNWTTYTTFCHTFFYLSFLTVLIGSLGALYQIKIKRFIAYSAISHIGYIGLGISMGSRFGLFAVFFYFMVYFLLNINFFLMYINLRNLSLGFQFKKINDLKLLAESNPLLAALFSLNLFSIAGVPPLAGFFSKFFILCALIERGFFLSSFFLVLISVLSSFYYIRLIKTFYYSSTFRYINLSQIPKMDAFLIAFTAFSNLFFIFQIDFFTMIASFLSKKSYDTTFLYPSSKKLNLMEQINNTSRWDWKKTHFILKP